MNRSLRTCWLFLAMALQFALIGMLVVCSVWPSLVVSANDVVALQGLFREWQGTPGGALLDNWSLNEDADPCRARWKGVVCSSSQSVVNLLLNNVGLSGGIPTAIGGLEKLEMLDLSGNTLLTSAIPKEIGLLSRLTHLNLSGCNFTGEVPQEIYKLSNLKSIDISKSPHLPVKPGAQLLISLNKQVESALISSRPHFFHHRSLLQSSTSGNKKPLPIFYTYIAVSCVGMIILIVVTFCCCRYLSVRKTSDDIFLTTPGAPGYSTTFQSWTPSKSTHIANRNLDMDFDRH